MGKRIDLTGKVFGRLTVLKREPKPEGSRDRHSRWLCKCSCGEVIVTTSDNLLSGGTKSCGCLKKETCIKNIMEYNNSEHESAQKKRMEWQKQDFTIFTAICAGAAITKMIKNIRYMAEEASKYVKNGAIPRKNFLHGQMITVIEMI